jgi:tRNA U38,U39,U40 pseudouridine synthase TruA
LHILGSRKKCAGQLPLAADGFPDENPERPHVSLSVKPAKKRRFPMLNYELNRAESILIVKPIGPLESTDFEKLVQEVDPYIKEKGKLNGLMIYAKSFPGWDSFAAFLSHMKFVKNHHQKIKKIAAVTGSGFLSIMPQVANHFVRAEIRHFDYDDKDAALNWLRADN